MLESAYKNEGLVNFIVESLAIHASLLLKYQQFAIPWCGHGVVMFESPYKNKGLVNVSFETSSKMQHV